MEKNSTRKFTGLKVIGGIFFVLLVGLIFLSKTIYTYNYATVTAVSPLNGRLSKSETVKGNADWTDITEIYAETTGKVDVVLVKEGDHVVYGQELIRMSFETEDIEQKLKEIEVSRERYALDIENIYLKIEKTNRNIEDLKKEVYSADSVSDYDLKVVDADIKANDVEIAQAEAEIARLEKEYDNLKTLYEIGAVSLSELETAERGIQSAYEKKATLEVKTGTLNDRKANTSRNIQESRTKNSESVAKQEETRRKQLTDYQADLVSCDQELKSKELDIKNLNLQEDTQLRTLEKYENNKVIYAITDSIIVNVNVTAGQRINDGQLIATCGLAGQYEVLCRLSLDNNFVMVGDTCTLQNTDIYLSGLVTKIDPTDQFKEATVLIGGAADVAAAEAAAAQEQGSTPPMPPGRGSFRRFGQQNYGDVNDVSAGETFDVTFEKESTGSYTLVPNGTLNMDSNGYFLYRVSQREGILGKEFYVEKLPVNIGDSDSENTVITEGIRFFEPIVSLSDKGFSEGDAVKLSNEGDFFAN